MPLRFGRGVAATVIAYCLLSPSEASADSFLITDGERIADLGAAENVTGGSLQHVGYKYRYLKLVGIDFWTWGGKYYMYPKPTGSISREEAAAMLGKSPGDIGPPFLYRFPLGLILTGFAVFVGLWAILKRKGGAPTRPSTSNSVRPVPGSRAT